MPRQQQPKPVEPAAVVVVVVVIVVVILYPLRKTHKLLKYIYINLIRIKKRVDAARFR